MRRGLLRSALRLGRVTPIGLAVGIAGEYAWDQYLYPTLQRWALLAGNWVVHFDCPTMSGGNWTQGGLAGTCTSQQWPGHGAPTPYDYIKLNPTTTGIQVHNRATRFVLGSWKDWEFMDISFSRPVNNGFVYPRVAPRYMPEEFPWPRQLPLPDPAVWPVGVPYPATPPAVRPAGLPRSTTVAGYSVHTSYQQQPRTNPRRAPRGTKERKIRGKNLLHFFSRLLGKILSGYSEVGDFVDSIHDALPKKYQTKDGNMLDKLNDIYENWDKVDMSDAIENLVKNEIEDQIVGRIIGRIDKSFRSVGFQQGITKVQIVSGY